MLTTTDNPYDPRTEYDQWMRFDQEKGYFTAEYLARVIDQSTDSDLSDEELEEKAIDEIVELNVLGIYKKI